MQRIAYSSSIPCKSQKESLASWSVFAVNRYESFMENKNMIRTFCGCKPWKKKNNVEPQQNFTGSYKKCEGSGLTPKFAKYQKVKR